MGDSGIMQKSLYLVLALGKFSFLFFSSVCCSYFMWTGIRKSFNSKFMFQKSPGDKTVDFDCKLLDKYQQNQNASGCQTLRLETPVCLNFFNDCSLFFYWIAHY